WAVIRPGRVGARIPRERNATSTFRRHTFCSTERSITSHGDGYETLDMRGGSERARSLRMRRVDQPRRARGTAVRALRVPHWRRGPPRDQCMERTTVVYHRPG